MQLSVRKIGQASGYLGDKIRTLVLEVVVLDVRASSGLQDLRQVELTVAQGDVVLWSGMAAEVPGDPLAKVLEVHEPDPVGIPVQEVGGILTGEVGPENVELEAHRLRIALLDHQVEERAVV